MRVFDISWWQYPVNTAEMAPAADGFWVRWADWVRWANYGGDEDPGHNDVIRGLQDGGKLAASYLFARPEMCGATQQVDTWASRVNATMTMPPMLDIERSGIKGNQLMDWTEEALQRMTAIWGWTPVHYFNSHLAEVLGTWRPTTRHLLMVPGYPYANLDHTRYPWDARDRWVDLAGGAAAVADYLPPGYQAGEVALWQYADTALAPGTGNVVDVNHAYPPFIDALGGSFGGASYTPPTLAEDDMITEEDFVRIQRMINDLAEASASYAVTIMAHAASPLAVIEQGLGELETSPGLPAPEVLAAAIAAAIAAYLPTVPPAPITPPAQPGGCVIDAAKLAEISAQLAEIAVIATHLGTVATTLSQGLGTVAAPPSQGLANGSAA